MRPLLAPLVLLAVASVARADALPADYVAPVCTPVTCPAGAVGGGGGHGSCPSVCVPWNQTCTADAECGGPGWSCLPTRFCLVMQPTGRMVQNVVVGECSPDGTCVEGTCAIESRCAPTPGYVVPGAPPSSSATTPSSAPPSSSMCAAHGRRPTSAPLALVAVLALALSRRRMG